VTRSAIRRVYLLDGGTLQVESSTVLPGSDYGRLLTIPVQVFIVETGHGFALIDTGNDPAVIDDPESAWGPDLAAASRPRVARHQHLAAQLALVGLAPGDIHAVVYTHLHHDHAGGARLFPRATHVVQRSELRWATSPDPHYAGAYRHRDFAGINWTLADGDCQALPGIHLMLTPGHTPGHQSVILWDVADLGTVILAGDAVNSTRSIEASLPPGIATDPVQALQSLHRLTTLARATDALLITGHDLQQFAGLPKAPEPLARSTPPVHATVDYLALDRRLPT
jgi:glyoxylase-like metal-dependent hydrolase (beta-lactamase superfamily II)